MGKSAVSAPAAPIVSLPVPGEGCDLLELLAGVPDGRTGQGRDHPVAAVLALAAAAAVAEMKGYTAISGWVADVLPPVLASLYLRCGLCPGLTRATLAAGSDRGWLTCGLASRLPAMWSLRTSLWKPSGMVSRFVRKVRTASGAVAVQVVTRRGRQVERVEHVGSAHIDAELALLLAAARERLSPGQGVLDLGDLLVVPARMDEVADWTGEPELPLRPAGAPPPSLQAGESWGRPLTCSGRS